MNTDKIYAEAIANEYAPKKASKVIALKKLDSKAKLPASVFTYSFGIAAALIAGIGMCLSMNIIGNGGAVQMAAGIVLGIIGFAAMSVNYPIYCRILEKSRQKYASDIIHLANEISSAE